jgi:hypothetical protein
MVVEMKLGIAPEPILICEDFYAMDAARRRG